MNLEELEEALGEILISGFAIETNKHGQVIIYTGLKQDEDGELVSIDDDSVDADADPDFHSIDDEDDEDD